MQFPCRITELAGGRWSVRHDGSAGVDPIEVTAETRDQAIEKMRLELQYRLELCPCTGESYRYIDIRLVDAD